MSKDSKQLKMTFPIIVVAALLTAGIFYYIDNMKNSLWNQAVSEVLEVTSQGSHTFEVYIEKDMQVLTRIEKHLSLEMSGDEAGIIDVIELFEDSGVSFTVIDIDNGIMYGRGSKNTKKIDSDKLAIYEMYEDKGIREPYMDEYTEQEVIGGYQRFTFADGTRGIVQVKRSMTVVADEFMLSFYDNTGFSYIANQQGDILLRPSHKNSNSTFSNIKDTIEFSDNRRENIEMFNESIAQKRKGAVRLIMDGEENILAFTPINNTDGWYLITILPDAVIMKHADEILKNSKILLILLGGVLAIVGLFIYMRQKSYKQIAKKEGDVQYRERLFGILANNTNDVFLMFSPNDYNVEYVSPNVERVLGISREEIKNDLRVLNDDKEETINYDFIKKLEMDNSVVYEKERIHRKNGEIRWFMDTVYKTTINNSERFVAVLSDRTHERRTEQTLKDALEMAKTANEAKSIFLSRL